MDKDNPATLAILDTQDEDNVRENWRALKNVQPCYTGNIGYTGRGQFKQQPPPSQAPHPKKSIQTTKKISNTDPKTNLNDDQASQINSYPSELYFYRIYVIFIYFSKSLLLFFNLRVTTTNYMI